MMIMKYPSKEVAEKELKIASHFNPGPWTGHSYYTGLACQYIAEQCLDLDADKAYVLGLLHDIGRRAGVTSIRHIVDGYNYSMSKGWEDVAKICMTHSYMLKNAATEIGKWDVSDPERDFIYQYIDSVTYDDYDKLVQLCDSLALDTGFCMLEKRFVNVTRRYGVCEYTVERWNKVFDIKEYFEDKIKCSIYDLLPNVKENTFRE